MLVLSLFIVFCHPMVTVFLIIMFSIFTCFELFKNWATGSLSNIEAGNFVIIVSLTFALWWLQFRQLLGNLETMVAAILGEVGYVSIIDTQVNIAKFSDASIWLVIERFIKMYGALTLYFSISLFFLLYMIYQYFQYRKIYEDDLIISLQFCVALLIGIALLFGYFIIAEPIRAAMFAIIIATTPTAIVVIRVPLVAVSD